MMLAEATMPTVSPGRKAEGLTRLGTIEEETGEGIRPILNEKLAPAEQLRRSGEKNFLLPAYGLGSAFGFDLQWGLTFTGDDCGHRRGARTGSRRARLAYPALEKAHLNMVFFIRDYQLNVNPMLEVMMTSNFSGFSLPPRKKFRHKDHKVRIPHRNRNTFHFARR